MLSEATPIDNFRILCILTGVVSVLVVMVAIQIVLKFVIFGRVLTVLARVEELLSMAEKHGDLTDRTRARVEERVASVEQKTDTTLAAVQQVGQTVPIIPERTVELIKQAAPPSWQAGDPDRRFSQGG